MTSSKNKHQSQPFIVYELTENDDEAINRAFDILFEEILKKCDDLTKRFVDGTVDM